MLHGSERALPLPWLSEAFVRIAASGYSHADLKVHADNLAAIGFYRRLGMVPVAG